MAKYHFFKEPDKGDEFDSAEVLVSTDQVCLPDLLEDFEYFLKGCGFCFDGTIEVVPNEKKE